MDIMIRARRIPLLSATSRHDQDPSGMGFVLPESAMITNVTPSERPIAKPWRRRSWGYLTYRVLEDAAKTSSERRLSQPPQRLSGCQPLRSGASSDRPPRHHPERPADRQIPHRYAR